MKNRDKWLEFIVTFGLVGRLPWAPGTFGSLAALLLVALLQPFGIYFYMLCILVVLGVGALACDIYESWTGAHDPGSIVIDEVLGILVTFLWIPLTWQSLLVGFFLFRLLDIWKPFPIGYLDRKVPGGWGVMADDLVAGLLSNFCLQILYTQTAFLGVQEFIIS